MKIKTLKVGPLETNCYILIKNNQSIVIDPGDDFQIIQKEIEGDLLGILITHSHFDHIGALTSLKEYYNSPVYSYKNIVSNKLKIKDFNFEIIKNPGHSFDSISFLIEEKLFSGDFIFKGTIGRTDLPTGDMNQMKNSINNILNYSDNLIIYPGHGEITTLQNERRVLNYFLT
ncbi:MAG: MBL fold metallo-hydrolase [Bacilli bacterium]|nr:MBL fold metallo-hydrolase [Bacilli bacterium]